MITIIVYAYQLNLLKQTLDNGAVYLKFGAAVI